jgi:ATP-dependent RNA helicase SUPV3L1/SUV3
MLAAAEKHLPQLLAQKAEALVSSELGALTLGENAILRDGTPVAMLEKTKAATRFRVVLVKDLAPLDHAQRAQLTEALELWLEGQLSPLAPLRYIAEAALDPEAGTEVRALLLTLVGRNGTVRREDAGLAAIPKEKRPLLRQLGVTIGSLDVFMPALLKPAPRALLHRLGLDTRPLNPRMEAVIAAPSHLPAGYVRAGTQAVRIDMAEKLFRAAHDQRAKAAAKGNTRGFPVDLALATSMGLTLDSFRGLMRDAGFRPGERRELAEGAFGPPAPLVWSWRPPRKDQPRNEQPAREQARRPQRGGDKGQGRDRGKPTSSAKPQAPDAKPDSAPPANNPFAALADLLR